jgi:hypothetical protein
MSPKRVLQIVAALIICGALFYFYAGHRTPSGQAPLSELTPENVDSIQNAFNDARGDVRLLVLLSPT